MKVKICGVKNSETVQAAVDDGADFLGFMFAKSKRQISLEQAKELAATVLEPVQKVGVFVNPTLEEVETAIREVKLDFVQLHGEESPSFCRNVSVPVIKAFSITSRLDLAKVMEYETAYYLLDSAGGKYRGGNGKVFDWRILEDVQMDRSRVMLAGGLTPANVQEAIQTVKPGVVDVSSGVETAGEKDLVKLRAFIDEAKGRMKQ
ncbi:phosphoribosylanthranilate isomerase [Salirhabdus sp. Marseille-P4669]|uniref:phosphoribosylanthranilate isomerase n=1 Tax=Salirhabdus sp. Marseille-P4669 TaxID=2042310 RepID=UPI000C7D85CA|nr:phosphoribosylanthranilate isomerase [Salirhabdus sp. Marseille-P4669]